SVVVRIDSDLLRQIAVRHRDGHIGNVAHLASQIAGHHVDAFGQILPNTADVTNLGLAAELAFGTDLARDASDFGGKGVELIHHGVDRFFELQNLAADVDGDLFGEIAVGDRDGDVSIVA